MNAETKCVLCSCGNIDCLDVVPQDPRELGVSEKALASFNSGDFVFCELHHMSLVVSRPEQVLTESNRQIYSIKCKTCKKKFLILPATVGYVFAFPKGLMSVSRPFRRGGNLVSFPNFPHSLRPFVCKAATDPMAMTNTTSFEDFCKVVPRDSESGEIMSYDTDLDVMFSPEMRDCFIGSFEDIQVPNFRE